MYLKISDSKPVLPLFDDEQLTAQQEATLIAKCPRINLHSIEYKQQINDFLISLFAYYFSLPEASITAEQSIVDDIERRIWAKELGVDAQDLSYGRIFCSTDEHGNTTGGLEDRGLIIAFFYMTELPDLLGLHVVDNKDEATFAADEDEFGSYYDCDTINALSTLIFSVCEKLQSTQTASQLTVK